MQRLIFVVVLILGVGISGFAQKGKKGAKQATVAPSKSAEQLKAEEDAKKAAALEAENKKKAEEEAERQRKLAEYEAKVKRVQSPDAYNKYSVRPILDKDIMYRKMVWRRLDMEEKQNTYFMVVNKELPRLIVEYIQMGKLKAFENDSLEEGRVLTTEKFQGNLKDPNTEAFDSTLYSDPKELAEAYSSYAKSMNLDPKLLTIVELKEDIIFDKKRSRMYYDILAVTLFIPAKRNPRGFNQPVATVKFKDLVELFKKDNRAIWFNRENDSEHRNFADAFELRLFSSYIVKVSNPNDELIVDTYGGDPKAGRYGSEKISNDLMEYEHNLWEF